MQCEDAEAKLLWRARARWLGFPSPPRRHRVQSYLASFCQLKTVLNPLTGLIERRTAPVENSIIWYGKVWKGLGRGQAVVDRLNAWA